MKTIKNIGIIYRIWKQRRVLPRNEGTIPFSDFLKLALTEIRNSIR